MANTWDTSRVGGGTYEFQKDASGNYTLNSVGFNKLNKLNLPELKAEATTTTTGQAKDTATASAQTTKAFGNVQPFYYNQKGGGGADQSMSITKDKTLTENLRTDTKPKMLGDTGGSMVRDTKPGMLGDTGGSIKRDTTPKYLQEADKRGYENIGKKVESTNQIGRVNAGQVLAARQDRTGAWDQGQWGPQPSNVYRSETEKFKTRFDPTQIKAAPQKANVVSTQLKSVRTALGPLAKAVGFVMNPVKGLIGMAAGALPKDSPTDKFNRQYFNTVGNTSRIAGNPTTDLYAGFNQTSAFGNTERAGASRIATREATIAKKGYTKTNDPTGFYAKTQKMKGDQNDYQRDKGKANTASAKTKGLDVSNPNEMRNAGGGSGNGGPRVICTYFYGKNQFSLTDLQLDTEFSRNNLSDEVKIGYWFWAIPLVDWMKKHENSNNWWVKLVKNSTKLFAQERAKEVAYIMGKKNKGSLIGKFVRLFGETGCYILGCIIKPFVFDKYKGFLNEYQKDVNLIGKI